MPSINHDIKESTYIQPVDAESNGVFINEETESKNEVHPITYRICDPTINDFHTGTSNTFLDAKKSALPNIDILSEAMVDAYPNASIGISSCPKQGCSSIAVHAHSYESPSASAAPKPGGKGVTVLAQLVSYMRGACIYSRKTGPETEYEASVAKTMPTKKNLHTFIPMVFSTAHRAAGTDTALSIGMNCKNNVEVRSVDSGSTYLSSANTVKNEVSPVDSRGKMVYVSKEIYRNVTASATSSVKDAIDICNPNNSSSSMCLKTNSVQNNTILDTPYASCTAQMAFAYAVTFLNYCGEYLFETIVRSGQDCIEPVSNGDIDAPVGEDDDQFIRNEFTGWSNVQDGEADPSCLLHITKPTALYAAHNKQLKHYRARFFDDSGKLMKEQVVGYGFQATPPDTTREYHIFVGWAPSNMVVTCDTDFHGEWAEKPKEPIVPRQEISLSYNKSYECFYDDCLTVAENIINGIEYIVIWDDKPFRCIARDIRYEIDNEIFSNATISNALGSSRIIQKILSFPYTTSDSVTTEPFLCTVQSGRAYAYSRTSTKEDGGLHTIEIYYQEK